MTEYWTIFVAAIAAGAASEAIRRYRAYKSRRLEIPAQIRNIGFWTDQRIIITEAIFAAVALAVPWTMVTIAVGTNYNLTASYFTVLIYPFLIWVFMRGLRPNLP